MQHNVFEAYGVDRYLTDYGLVISRDYRQRGIAGEMLKARVDVTKSLGLAVTSSAFTAVGSQKAAEKAGYKEVFSVEFEEVGKVFTSFDFSQATSASAKILDFKI
jgi:GNAT superfamily N-acetyltransferase